MAYDPNDPADKKIVDKMIADALAEQAEQHEEEIEGLRNKRDELLKRLKKAREGENGDQSAEVDRLENEVADLNKQLRQAKKDKDKAERERDEAIGERDTAVSERDTERANARDLFVTGELTSALGAVNVPEELRDGASALLRGKVSVKEVNGERQAFVGDKSLGDFVKDWSQGDQGKHYVAAPGNGGGGANQTKTPQGGSKKTLAEMGDAERAEWAKSDPQAFAAAVQAAKQNPPKAA